MNATIASGLRRASSALLAAVAATAALLASACERDSVRVADAWIAATPPGAATAAAYMTIASGTPDRLLGGRSAVSRAVELHTHVASEGGFVRMTPVDSLPIVPGAPAVLAPGGDHLMLSGLERALAPGEEIVVVLEFERADEQEITMPVRDLRADTSEHHHHGP